MLSYCTGFSASGTKSALPGLIFMLMACLMLYHNLCLLMTLNYILVTETFQQWSRHFRLIYGMFISEQIKVQCCQIIIYTDWITSEDKWKVSELSFGWCCFETGLYHKVFESLL